MTRREVLSAMASCVVLGAILTTPLSAGAADPGSGLSPEERLGKSIFFDTNLSIDSNQACAACHAPEAGWTGPLSDTNAGGAVYEGSIGGRFGNRKPPSAAYATPSPVLGYVIEHNEALFIGGNFWNGRATGEKLDNPAADQAQFPFVNPLEQASPDSACIVYKVCTASYPASFEDVWGAGACDIAWPHNIANECRKEGRVVKLSAEDSTKVKMAYDNIALSIAAYEDSSEVNQFSSKFDRTFAGEAKLTQQEQRGYALFRGKALCSNCHIANGQHALFTDFTYDNLGVPRNPENPFYGEPEFNPLGAAWIDLGLGGFLETRMDYQKYAYANNGKQKVPTLRNVDKRPYEGFVKAYSHNGYFKSLKGIVHFYNTRDTKPRCESQGIYDATETMALANDCWPKPEVSVNVNHDELGDLGLSPEEEDAIVAFLKTLSDGYEP
ncbi:MAG: cytochrome c peroxidase [Chromatiaceae bacterium]